MASEIRVNTINNRSGLGTVSITDTGLVVSGIITATSIDTSSTSAFSSDVSIADKIIHTGDTNTAIRFPANDQISFEVGGVERLRVHSNNYIGINSSIPLRPLDVTAPLGVNIPLVITSGSNQTNGFIAIKDPNTSGNFNNRIGCEGDNLLFWTGGGEALRITSAGNVGIGTDDPGNHKLHLYGETNSDLKLTATGDDIVNIFVDSNRSSADTPIFAIKGEWNGTQIANMKFVAGADTTNKDDGYITFNTRESGTGASSERLRITSSGKISINNTSGPTDIPGTAHDTVVVGNSAATGGGITLEVASGNNCGFQMYAQGSQPAGRFLYDGSDNTVKIWSQNSGGTSESTRMTFKEDGNVEINDGNLVLASGHGIDFSATSDGAGSNISELLHDYEEGTFSPTLVTNGGSGGVGGYGNRGGSYTKIGRKVTIYGRLTITNKGTLNGSIAIGNLPFACAATVDTTSIDGWGVLNYFAGVDGSNTTDFISVSNIENTNLAVLYRGNQSGGMSGMDQGHITNAFDCRFGITYQTTS